MTLRDLKDHHTEGYRSSIYITISVVPILGFAYNSDADIIGN